MMCNYLFSGSRQWKEGNKQAPLNKSASKQCQLSRYTSNNRLFDQLKNGINVSSGVQARIDIKRFHFAPDHKIIVIGCMDNDFRWQEKSLMRSMHHALNISQWNEIKTILRQIVRIHTRTIF